MKTVTLHTLGHELLCRLSLQSMSVACHLVSGNVELFQHQTQDSMADYEKMLPLTK